MHKIPSELKYSPSHQWIHIEDDGNLKVGITDYAQDALGDLVFIALPEVNRETTAGEEIGVVESAKSASDFYSPVSGKIIAVNEKLINDPTIINQDPYKEGWIFCIKPNDESEIQELLDAESYEEQLKKEG